MSHRFTSSASEDAGVSPVWTIADTVSFRQFGAAALTWTSSDGSLKMAVLGKVTDATPPAFRSARVDGVRLKVTFDEDLDQNSAPDGSAFHIFGAGPSIVGTGTAVIDGATVTVTLERAVPANRTVSLSYLIPDENPLQDAADNAVPGFGPNPMTNNSNTTTPAFVSATFKVTLSTDSEPNDSAEGENQDPNELTVTFNEELDPAFAPAGSAFTLREQGGSRVIAGIGTAVIDGEKVRVMLAEAPDLFKAWRVSYVRPSGNGLRDYTGRLAHNFSNRPATYKPSGKTVDCKGFHDTPDDDPNDTSGRKRSDDCTGNNRLNDTLGDDTLNGGPGNDGLYANSGDDVLNGGPGHDRLYGDAHGSGAVGNDTLNGGPGNDYLVGGPGADKLDGGQPNHPTAINYGDPKLNYYEHFSDWSLPGDTASYWWSSSGVTVNLSASTAERQRAGCAAGKGGNAEGDCLTGIENIIGSEHRDNLTGSEGPNLLRGGNGADVLDGFDGHEDDAVDYRDSNAGVKVDLYVGGGDTAPYGRGYCNNNSVPRRCGFAGSDIIRNIRTVHGSNHYDGIIGDDNDNTLYGHRGNDELKGEGGEDTLDGGAGNDTASYATSDAGVNVNLAANTASGGHADDDTFISIENLTGSPHEDTLAGNALPNVLDGGNGYDTADYSSSGAAVTVNLAEGTAAGGHAYGDTLVSIENLTGSPYADRLTGDRRNNVLRGGDGDDVLNGGPGMDIAYYEQHPVTVTDNGDGTVTVTGPEGNDTLTGIEFVMSAAVDGTTLTVTFDVDLDENLVPAPGDFQVTENGVRLNVASGGVAIAGRTVTLTLETAVNAPSSVKLSYTSRNRLRDSGRNYVPSFSPVPVTNNTQ